jgi:serpin B
MRRAALLLVPVVILAAAGAGAWWWFSRESDTPPPPWTDDMQTAADANNRFAFDLYAKLREQDKEKGNGNLFFSPYSAHAALAMTATGARGPTRDEMLKVLHFAAVPEKVAAAGDVGRFYSHPRKAFQLSVANGLWGQKGYPWRPEFLGDLQSHFGAAFHEADYGTNADGERARINRWVEEKTRDRIKELLAPGTITSRTRMVLANAIYFKGAWQEQFDPKQTRPMPFTLHDGTKTDVPMMHREGGFKWHYEFAPGQEHDFRRPLEIQVAELPYKGDELSMVVLLPGKHDH